MNNGQPPYGDPSAWGQQGNQANPGQYPVQQAPYGQPEYVQQPQQGVAGYSQPFQPVETYQQQAHPQQQTYQQQSWQPYQQPGAAQGAYPQMPGPQPQQFYGQTPNYGPVYGQQRKISDIIYFATAVPETEGGAENG